MKDIKFVYLDLGGVLFNWKSALKELSLHFDRDYEKVFEVFKTYDNQACLGNLQPNELWQKYKSILQIEDDIPDFSEWWTDHFTTHKKMQLVVTEIIKKYKVGIVTNIYFGTLAKLLEKEYLPRLPYTVIIESCEIGLVKPDTAFFTYAHEKAGVRPNEILFVDDSEKNIDAAKKFGWRTFLFNDQEPEKAAVDLHKYLFD